MTLELLNSNKGTVREIEEIEKKSTVLDLCFSLVVVQICKVANQNDTQFCNSSDFDRKCSSSSNGQSRKCSRKIFTYDINAQSIKQNMHGHARRVLKNSEFGEIINKSILRYHSLRR